MKLGRLVDHIEISSGQLSNDASDKLINELTSKFEMRLINQIIVATDPKNEYLIQGIISLAENKGIRPSFVLNFYSIFKRDFFTLDFYGLPVAVLREIPLDIYSNYLIKRIFDFLVSAIFIILLSPLFFLIAICIYMDSSGPIFYSPIRIGKNNSEFRMFKFRSMRVNQTSDDKMRSAQRNDSRITRVGKIIRKVSLDELPQLFNVFIGDMSIIGPRPHRVDLDRAFQKIIPVYSVRQYVKPGITGWAQVNGFRGPTNTRYDYVGRTLHDLWYIEHWTFSLDIYILLLTIFGRKTYRNAF
jgi:putative colanic acid biosynthesis UDP-glucose lipid carrier transferase